MDVRDNTVRKRLLQERKLALNTCVTYVEVLKPLKAMSGPSQCDVNKVKSKHGSFKDMKEEREEISEA